MRKNKLHILIFLLTVALAGKAQDFHLSQYDMAGMYINPALTGMYGGDKGDYKIYADYRSQWRSLGVKPFSTTYLAYDMPYQIKDKKIGLGGYFVNNRTGPGNFNTTELMISGAYDILNEKAKEKHYLTTGLQMGIFYKAFNTNRLTYDVQYTPSLDGGSFDKNVSSGEVYSNTSIVRFDANYGIYYKFIDPAKKAHPFVGLSLSHFTKPNESFVGTKDRMPIRFLMNGGCDIKLNDKFDITPRFLYMNQAKSSEINAGILAYYKITENDTKVMAGFDYRHKDAVILHLGVKQDNYYLRFSYDINTSYLNTFSKNRGAWEISLVLVGEKKKPFFKALGRF